MQGYADLGPCFGADAIKLLVSGIDFCLLRGLDYENPYVLKDTMVYRKIEGCTGPILLDAGYNRRI